MYMKCTQTFYLLLLAQVLGLDFLWCKEVVVLHSLLKMFWYIKCLVS